VASGKTAVGLRLAREWATACRHRHDVPRLTTWPSRKASNSTTVARVALAWRAEFDLGQPTDDEVASITSGGDDITARLRSA
jgi:hypothetical protein